METINKKKANYQQIFIDRGVRAELFSGINNEPDYLPKPKLIRANCEKVIEGITSARIVFGKDRNDGIDSGYGGLGDSKCSSIDVVVEPVMSLFDPLNEKQFCNPNFKLDAARIYLSGKTNIDEYFGVPDPEELSRGKAGVAVFSDCSRIFARQDIRIVSGISDKNARGGNIYESYGIQLIGRNNPSSLQPAVLGDNLVDMNKEVIDVLDGIVSMIDSFVNLQMEFNKALAEHKHYSPFFGQPTTPSEIAVLTYGKVAPEILTTMKTSILSLRTKLASISNNYLSGIGGESIRSDNVELN